MILGRVLGPVVGTVKHRSFDGQTLFVVQPLDAPEGPATTSGDALTDAGDTFLAVDHAQAGPGDVVLVLGEGNGIRQVLGDPTSPIRRLIVGVVDRVDVG